MVVLKFYYVDSYPTANVILSQISVVVIVFKKLILFLRFG